jgi:predicted AlkP superfamily pyrophosphatase or phosphodiesterase
VLPRLSRLALVACVAVLLLACRAASVPPERAIVILVSIDGFRWDYLEKFSPPTLLALAAGGVRSDGLIPQFPSKTFPNHYTLVTGLRLGHHGILSNNMVAPGIPGRFSLSNRPVLADARWWGGEPIWNTAERQGLRASAMFWPGSEAPIGGRKATYWLPYDQEMPNAARVAKTLEWLAQPEDRRPSFLTLYFSDVDTAGHSRGPDSQDARDAVARVDESLAQLVNGVRAAGLTDRVHYVVVSDHGMASLSPDRMILLDDLVDTSTVDVVDWSPVLALSPKDGNVETLYAALKDQHPALTVYKSADLPAKYGLAGHPRLPAVVGIADEGWYVTSVRETERWGTEGRHAPGGTHGYDPQLRSMHGLFIAAGSKLPHGMRVAAFENIHVYEFLCALLGLQPALNDGDPAVTRPMLR